MMDSELIEEQLCKLQLDSTESSSRELVEEITEEEILPRTTVKTALRLRCVSKTWRTLIDTETFIEKHFRNSTRRRIRPVFNHCRECGPRFSPCYLGDTQPSVDPPPSDEDLLAPRCYIVGHHNGLLCILKLQKDQQSFFLWNPATRISVQLPDPGLVVNRSKLGFGWDEQSMAYKVFLGVPDHPYYHQDDDHEGNHDDEDGDHGDDDQEVNHDDEDGDHGDDDHEGGYDGRIARIYSSETNSWRAVEHGSKAKVGVFAGGKIYWLTASGQIEYLDLKNEVFGKTMIDHPCKFEDDVLVWLWERKGSLCIVCDPDICIDCDTDNQTKRVVWVMKKGEQKNDWVKDKGFASELSMKVTGVNGAFNYVETLIAPPPLLLEKEE